MSDQRVAAYVAKYATKGAESAGRLLMAAAPYGVGYFAGSWLA
ncbi:hypothetical protein ABZW11_45895 [Nonomuraea sp. NPDC004580]